MAFTPRYINLNFWPNKDFLKVRNFLLIELSNLPVMTPRATKVVMMGLTMKLSLWI